MKTSRPQTKIQKEIFKNLVILVVVMTLLVSCISIAVYIHAERRNLDQNLQNMAQTIANSVPVQEELKNSTTEDTQRILHTYLDSLKETLSNVDVISIIGTDNIRRYHSNASMIGTVYDGTIPEFQYGKNTFYVTSDIGPSGSQRRAYAAVYDNNGQYLGFVLAVMLNQNINRILLSTVWIHLIAVAVVILFATFLSRQLSRSIKNKLYGYEPDSFRAMFTIREHILDSLEEGIIGVGVDGTIIYGNKAAKKILGAAADHLEGQPIETVSPSLSVHKALTTGEKAIGISVRHSNGADIIVDKIPITEQEQTIGAFCILRDRTEYTRLMEDLTGVRYMVDSMRANSHDFVNKLHVILGLIQMGKTEEASEYITRVATIQQAVLRNIVKSIEDPSVAALIIGKYSRASELNIQFTLKNGSHLNRDDIAIPSGDLVTIIGNLLDNAMDSMNQKNDPVKDLSIGIYTQSHAILITVDDTGVGIREENKTKIFENGFTTKGHSHGTGLYIVKNIVDRYKGTITVDSEFGFGTSFTITISN